MSTDTQTTVGAYLATRMEQIGLQHYFAVPGDYNLVLLDELLKNESMQMISCCNELNAGYAADGYCRASGGPAAVIVTFSVGGLSLSNAVAGAYAEDLPLIAISGGPNSNSQAENELLHHTLGKVDYTYQREIFSRITVKSVIVKHVDEAAGQIDRAIHTALRARKPVYLEIASNIAALPVPSPAPISFPAGANSDQQSLAAAVEHAADLLNAAVKPVLVAGVKLRPGRALIAFQDIVQSSGFGVASMPNAKGFLSEQHAQYMGIYWGPVSSSGCGEIVESADLALYAGPSFTDYTTTGHAALINPAKMIVVNADSVVTPTRIFNDVNLSDFLSALAPKLNHNDASLVAYQRIKEHLMPPAPSSADAPLTTRHLFASIQQMLEERTSVIAETGDSWFNGMNLELPEGAKFEIQMQYGSIGWSVGATLGYCLARPERRVIALIGDGSFQMTAQEVSTMIRYGVRPIIFLINNGGYTIEVEIHDGPYNTIKNWDYAALMAAFNAGSGNGWGARVGTEGELAKAIAYANDHNGPALIEVLIDRDDCSKNLLEWGGYVARNNGRPPKTA
ncbi:MAG: thiamine pyrophosphate-binding protein [Candidatus Promineifilaceae bacterium]|nr:thiamine pyrophosphate-binding protein [Candidatus Promineifilaceae bacterium]